MNFTDAIRSAVDQYPGFEGRVHRARRAQSPLIAFLTHVGPTAPLTQRRAHRADHPGRFGPGPLIAG
ncbi:hypothetical protein U0E10_29355 [Burkholderia ubonensis]|uniref:hypothetical protein n=1 Tax=Burkholderia ubonensis TaxID=101571 RepID=UPI002AB4D64C|nr:hypothetical protein [Burkholderia ubonensis]MDY7792006.1 hypothetical protein [Burkholderia ubonensis]